MKIQVYDLDKPGEMKTVFETDRSNITIPLDEEGRRQWSIKLHEDGTLEISAYPGGLIVKPRYSNQVILEVGKD